MTPMTPAALGLVLTAAAAHATWNLLAKRTGGGGAFVWLSGCVSAVLYAPLAAAVILWQRPHLGWVQWAFIVGTVVFHVVYFLLLQGAYDLGELSLVYPLARGTGPLLSAAAADRVPRRAADSRRGRRDPPDRRRGAPADRVARGGCSPPTCGARSRTRSPRAW